MCSIDDSEPWQVYREAHRTAAKAHRCYECGRTIEPGERYLHAVGMYDDRWDRMRMCAHCQVGADWLRVVCGGFSWGIVLDEVGEHWDEEPGLRSLGLGRFVVRSMAGQWRRNGALVPVPSSIPVPEALQTAGP